MKSEIITVDGTEIEFTRKRIKNVHIRINYPSGKVTVSAPMKLPFSEINRFILMKSDWIKEHQKKIVSKQLDFYEDEEKCKFYRKELQGRIDALLPELTKRTGLYPKSVKVRKMNTRFGSCNTVTGDIRISLNLAKYPDKVLECVLIHELIHLKIRGHGSSFKAEMTKYCPYWKEIKKEM